MKSLGVLVVALAFLFTSQVLVAAASTDSILAHAGSGQLATVPMAHNTLAPLSALPSPTTYLAVNLALTKEDNNGKAKGHDKDWKKDKPDHPGKPTYHGAEMSPAAALIAGTLAIGGYLFILNRRRAARQRA